ncbi:MAG TPA: hypothetical protein VK177_19855 [Flavobacteriales bacterium]|nr:hypothetical protein [Flavobacteriales bacterium]
MNTKLILLAFAALSFTACGGGDKEAEETDTTITETAPEIETTETQEPEPEPAAPIDQRDPEKVVEGIFTAAGNGDYKSLAVICADDADGDCKKICSVATADAKDQAEFKEWFGNGGVVNTEINGTEAQVEIKFGPAGKEKKETMNLVLKNGKWYLKSF